MQNDLHSRLQRVLRHIQDNLTGDLSVEKLSAVAAYSKHHFHRQFTALFGIGVHRYVLLLRLRRAAYRLAFRGSDSVLDIALDAGYEGPEAFSRAFKQLLGQTPTDFRANPQWESCEAALSPTNEIARKHMTTPVDPDQVRIVEFEETPVAMLQHRGDPRLIGDTIRRFIAWRKQEGLHPRDSATFNILYDDPATTPSAEFRFGLCAATARPVEPNDTGVVADVIPGGRCAVLRHTGSDERLGPAVSWLYAEWLPQSGEEPRDFPLYCRRVVFFPDVPEQEAVTDIYLPLR